jgi:hypothetical protein
MAANTDVHDLRQVLEEVAERIARYRGARIGEQNTKAALIAPVLRALGWNTEDLDEVHLEYKFKTADRPVDYALLIQRKPVLLLEAKGLDEDPDDRRWATQIIGYATVAGVEWVVLTNGDGYRIYNSHAPVALDDKLFRSFQVSGDVGEAADALRLLTKAELRSRSLEALWRAESVDKRVREAVEGLFEPEPSPWLVRGLARSVEGLAASDIRAALTRARISLDFPPAVMAETNEATTPVPPPAASSTPPPTTPPTTRTRKVAERYDVTVKDLLDAGLIRPGMELRQRYLGQEVRATIEHDGRVRHGDQVYNSLSIAAGAARVAVKGPPPDGRRYYQTNGWTFWEYTDAGGTQKPIETLRKQYLGSRS